MCCAKLRTIKCEECTYYIQSGNYIKEKSKKPSNKPFIAEINPEIEEKVDHALAMVENGNLSSGENILSNLIKKYPQIASVHYGMGVIYAMKEQIDKAISCFNKAVDIYPYHVEAWFNKGIAHQKKFEISPMIRAFQQVVRFGNHSMDYVVHAKKILKNMEKHIRETSNLTIDTFLETMDVFQDANDEMEKGEWEKAIKGFTYVLSKNPQHIQSNGNLGICYAFIGNKKEALTHLDRALELDPHYQPAKINRNAVLSLADGEQMQAEKHKSVDYYKDSFNK
jgi:tetratricopeptide (TPR) repeat protein